METLHQKTTYLKKLKLESFTFTCGETIPLTLAYETYGELNESRNNVILICHTLTGSSHVASHHKDDQPGWWEDMVGKGKAINTDKYFVVCINVPGSCYGSTGPVSTNPGTDRPYGMDFPKVTITDMVRVQKKVLEQLGMGNVRAVIGGSIGGQQVLEWGKLYPRLVRSLIPIATGASLNPQILGFGYIAQNAIKSDPNWQNGDYYGTGKRPTKGLAIARQLGHLTYLSRPGMEERFGRKRRQEGESDFFPEFEVKSYLSYQGEKFTKRFDANSYLYLTEAMHQYDLSGNETEVEALKGFKGKVLIFSISSDWHFTVEEAKSLETVFKKVGASVEHRVIRSNYGHDAFLVEIDKFTPYMERFLKA